jgi:hypothetical protein
MTTFLALLPLLAVVTATLQAGRPGGSTPPNR